VCYSLWYNADTMLPAEGIIALLLHYTMHYTMRANYCRAYISLCSPLESALQFYGTYCYHCLSLVFKSHKIIVITFILHTVTTCAKLKTTHHETNL